MWPSPPASCSTKLSIRRGLRFLQPKGNLTSVPKVAACPSSDTHRHGFGNLDAVHRRGQDAARIASALPSWIQTARAHALQIIVVAPDTNRRGGTGLHAGQHAVGQVEAFDLFRKGGQRLTYCGDGVIGQGAAEVA